MTPEEADNAQQWKGMDGATAYHLIDRHADGWGDVGEMMNAWLRANTQAKLATLKQAQEPVGYLDDDLKIVWRIKANVEVGDKLYTSAPAIPAGWQLVPVEPTHQMIEAGNDGFRNPDSRRHTVSSCYKSMLAAAPKPGEPA